MIRKALISVWRFAMPKMQSLCPGLWARIQYKHFYGKNCDLKHPKTLSEKLLWLWLHDYRANRTIMEMNDKYEVRAYIERYGYGELLNELYFMTDDPDSVSLNDLPQRFALKLSQGWNTNLICEDKSELNEAQLRKILNRWHRGQFFYDLGVAKTGGVRLKDVRKHYICERFLSDDKYGIPNDYKIYCFHGVPTAILYISDRFKEKKGCFMSPEWTFLGDVDGKYIPMEEPPERPRSLDVMLEAARKISADFPFVRVDFYDENGQAIFGETTFFPNGCIGMQEIAINGTEMGELLHLPTDND